MRKYWFTLCLLTAGYLGHSQELQNLEDSLNYSYGVQLAEMVKSRMSEWDADVIALAIKETLDGEGRMTLRQCQDVAQAYAAIKSEEAKAEGRAFMAEYAKKEGVMTTESGLMYRHIVEGTGEHPTAQNRVTVHYQGQLIDGTEFDSSIKRGEPMSFALNGVIQGWTEGVQLMKVGGRTEFVVPSELGYGGREMGKIPAHSVLIFEISLLSYQ